VIGKDGPPATTEPGLTLLIKGAGRIEAVALFEKVPPGLYTWSVAVPGEAARAAGTVKINSLHSMEGSTDDDGKRGVVQFVRITPG
jgi:hypothetical protein